MTVLATSSLVSPARAEQRPTRFPVWTVVLCASAVAAYMAGPQFEYDRAAIVAGQWWRAVTGHLAHWSPEHLFWDVVVFAVLGALNERRDRRAFLKCFAGAAVLITAGLWFLRPDVTHYRGLSGIDSALFVMTATAVCAESLALGRRRAAAMAALALAAFAAKVLCELLTGTALFVDASAAGFETIPLAHAVGAGVGLLLGLGARRRSRAMAALTR